MCIRDRYGALTDLVLSDIFHQQHSELMGKKNLAALAFTRGEGDSGMHRSNSDIDKFADSYPGAAAVSYTHLDVYKRQGLDLPLPGPPTAVPSSLLPK